MSSKPRRTVTRYACPPMVSVSPSCTANTDKYASSSATASATKSCPASAKYASSTCDTRSTRDSVGLITHSSRV